MISPNESRSLRSQSGGFTLIELLVVIAVIGLLTAVALPTLTGAREAARRTACSMKLSSVAMLLRAYASDYAEQFPRVQDASYGTVRPSYDPSITLEKTWVDLLTEHQYLSGDLASTGVPSSLTCPSARGYDNDPTWAGHMPHFGVNVNLNPPKRLEPIAGRRSFFGRPFDYPGDHSQKIMMAESAHLTNARGWFSVGNINWVAARHGPNRSANVAYLDGHVALRGVTNEPTTTSITPPFAGVNFWRNPTP